MAAQLPFLQEDPFPGMPHSSSWSTIESTSSHAHNRKKSNNPYRQGRDMEPGHPGIRKKTPTRGAVFEDLPTAHSSITSGKLIKAHARGDATTNDVSNEDEHSIPLQELDPTNRPEDFSCILPLPPLPAVLPEGRYNEEDCQATDEDIIKHHVRKSQMFQSAALAPSKSIFTNIRTALASISSPLAVDAPADKPPSGHWPRDSLDLDDNLKRRSLRQAESNAGYQENTRGDTFEGARNGDTGSSHVQHTPNANQSSIYHSSLGHALSGSLSPKNQQYPENAYLSEIEHNGSQSRNYSCGAQLLDFSLPPPQKSKLISEPSKTRSLSNAGSLPDGSTVDNIYKHYVRSDGLDQISDEDDEDSEPSLSPGVFNNQLSIHATASNGLSNDQVIPSAHFVRKQQVVDKPMVDANGEPPNFSLPKMPNPISRRLAPSSTQGLGHSSSYGDTRQLLEITQRTNWTNHRAPISRSDGRADLRSDQADSESEEYPQPSLPRLNPGNPFQSIHSPQVVISPAEDSNAAYEGNIDFQYPKLDRLPLEREVSEALRRASGFSACSNASISSSILDRYGEQIVASMSKSVRILRRQKIEDTPPSDSGSMGDNTRAVADQAKAFYDQGAIASNWLTTRQQNLVRVPINHNGSMPDSPPDSPPRDTETQFGRRQPTPEDDHNDWETVGESGFGFGVKSSEDPGLIGGAIHRAGSSIANTSDEGTASSQVPEIEDFGSTERIAQHPGHIRYFGDYRQRDLKKTHIPVFLPVFREHKINGYLADSTRIRPPPPPFNFAPPRLSRTHTNPFQSSPPEVKPIVRIVKPSGMPRNQRGRNANHFQPSLQTLQTESENADQSMEATAERSQQTYNWMDDFGEPGPAISNRGKYLQSPRPERPSSWQHIMGVASQSGNNDSSSITDGYPQNNAHSNLLYYRIPGFQGRNQTDGLAENETSMSGRSLTQKTEKRAPFVKGPPGAFYQGLRSKPGESKRRSWSEQHNVSGHQSSVRDYPTNTLRPLSLLKDPRPSTPVKPNGRSENLENDFVYRSPLAPPKRDSWKKLYSKQQLQGIQDAAKADGFVEAQVQSNAGLLGGSAKEGGSRKHLFETPTLKLWKRDDSTRTDLSHKKTHFSIIVLCMCTVFPPMLILYALGRLDGIIMWWTSGEYSTFAKKQKRWAYILMCCWGVATFLGLVVFLVYWFSGLRSPG